MKYRTHKFAWAVIAALVLYALPAGLVPLFDLDEGAYTEVTREMLVSGDFFATFLNGVLFYDKPALMYWLQAVSHTLFSAVNLEFAYRLPAIIALALTAWRVHAFASTHLNTRVATYAVYITVLTFGANVIGKSAIADSMLILLISLALFALFDFYKTARARDLTLAYVWVGLGVLTKGPIAIIVVGGTFTLFLLLQGRIKDVVAYLRTAWGWLWFLAIALPWYGIQYARFGDVFLDGFFWEQNVSRFLSPMDQHAGDVFYYVGALFLLAMPFVGLLIHAIYTLARHWRTLAYGEVRGFLLAWFLVVFVFFTFAATKLPHYLMYGMVPVWLLLAISLTKRPPAYAWHGVGFFIPWLVMAGAPWYVSAHLEGSADAFNAAMYGVAAEVAGASLYYYPMLAVALVLLMALWVTSRMPARLWLGALVLAFCLNYAFVPLLGYLAQAPVVNAARFVKTENLQVVHWRIWMPSFNVYSERISTPRKALQAGDVVFTKAYHLADITEAEVLFRERGVVIARVVVP